MSMRHRGFTLVELLVALFITAIMFAMGYGAINQALTDREAVRERQERLVALQRTMRLLVQDFSQLAPRPVREPIGDGWQPALSGAPESVPQVAFTRSGWANPAGIQRPALQRVAYTLENDTLVRTHWPVLDAPLGLAPVERELLDGVRTLAFRYMDSARQWREQWPHLIDPSDPESHLRLRPVAVEVTLELEDWGRIVRLIEVGA